MKTCLSGLLLALVLGIGTEADAGVYFITEGGSVDVQGHAVVFVVGMGTPSNESYLEIRGSDGKDNISVIVVGGTNAFTSVFGGAGDDSLSFCFLGGDSTGKATGQNGKDATFFSFFLSAARGEAYTDSDDVGPEVTKFLSPNAKVAEYAQ